MSFSSVSCPSITAASSSMLSRCRRPVYNHKTTHAIAISNYHMAGSSTVHRSSLLFRPSPSPRNLTISHGIGKDTVTSWLDLAGFVATSSQSAHTPFDQLAEAIGRDVYIDVAGWHLFLKDVKVTNTQFSLAQAIASQLGAEIQANGYQQSAVDQLLKRVPVGLGGGKTTVALVEVLPSRCVSDVHDICERYARDI